MPLAVGCALFLVGLSLAAAGRPAAAASLSTPTEVSSPQVSLSTTAAGATGVVYTVTFTTSPTGAVPSGGQLTLAAPAGTVFPSQDVQGVAGAYIGEVYDETTGQDLGYSRGGTATGDDGSTVTWNLEPALPAGHEIQLTIPDVTNPATGTYQLGISTSADTAVAETDSYTLTAPQALGNSTVQLSDAGAGDTDVDYYLDFTTSSTGGLNGGQLTVDFPAGTSFELQNIQGVNGVFISYITAGTNGWEWSRGGTVSQGPGGTVEVTWNLEPDYLAGEDIFADISGVTNPSAGTYQLSLSTSSDTVPVSTAPYTITGAGAVSDVSVALPTTAAAGASANYAVTFTASTAMSGDSADSAVDVGLPDGTDAVGAGALYDGSTEVGTCSGAGASVNCAVADPVAAGDSLTADFPATNPSPGSYTLSVSTSSDPVPVTSPDYVITAPQPVTAVTPPSLTTVGSPTDKYSFSFTTSSTGGLSQAADSEVFADLPTGTSYSGGGTVTDGGVTVAAGCTATTTGVACPITGTTAPGDTLTVSFLAGDPSPGTYSLGVRTSSDTTEVTSPAYSTGLSATVTATPDSGTAPFTSDVKLSISDATGDPVTYSLAFGDGTAQTATVDAPYAPITVSHLYTKAATDTVAVSVQDSNGQTARTSTTVTAFGVPTATASPGEPQEVVAGAPVTLNGSGSQPSNGISSYAWTFGDGSSGSGAIVTHAYSNPGTYTVTLTVTTSQASSTNTTTVQVDPAPTPAAKGLAVTVTDTGGAPLSGVSLAIMAGDTRYPAVTDDTGSATFYNLPDGSYDVDAYQQGYLPNNVAVTQVNGAGSGTIVLQSGSIEQSSATATPMTEQQIIAAGLNPDDPANQNALQVSVHLAIPQPGQDDADVDVSGVLSGCGLSGVTVDGGSGGGSGGCGPVTFTAGGYQATASVQPASGNNTQPSIVWMFVPLSAQWTKEFFNVTVLITNLAPEGNTFDAGTVTLGDLPAGLSLAPTAQPQAMAQTLPSVTAGGSQSVSWVLRGDAEGFYGVSATYQGTLDPGAFPLSFSVQTDPAAIHVWGASAVTMTVSADSQAVNTAADDDSGNDQGNSGNDTANPFVVNVTLQNVADIPLYNVAITLSQNGQQGFVLQPLQQLSFSGAELDPGQTLSGTYRLVPAVSGTIDLSKTVLAQIPGGAEPPTTVTTHPATVPLTVTSQSSGGTLQLTWDPAANADGGYWIFYTPNLSTPFGSTPIATVPAGTTMATLANAADGWYAIDTLPQPPPPSGTPVGAVMLHQAVQLNDDSSGPGQPTAPTFTEDLPPTMAVTGVPYTYTFQAIGTPATIKYALSCGISQCPSWLTIGSSTGVVTGTPPTGTVSFTYQVTASNGVAPDAITPLNVVTVMSGAPSFTADTPPLQAATGIPYGYTFQATGTPATMAYRLTGAPSWLTIGAATGTLSGTPPTGTRTFSYSVTASNGVNPNGAAGPFTVTVGPDPTTVTLTGPAKTTYGAETVEVLTATVTTGAPSTLIPKGAVAVTQAGSAVCTIKILANGTGTCTLKATQLTPGSYSLTGAFDPATADYAVSTSAALPLEVDAAPTSVTLTPPSALTFGSEQKGKLAATVVATGTKLSGTVSFQVGPLTICSASVSGSGKASCQPSSTELPVGSYVLSAVFTPATGNLLASASPAKELKVAAAATTTTVKVSPATAGYGQEGKVTFTAKVTATGLTPTGTVDIVAGGQTLCSVTVSGTGKCSLTPTQLAAGTYSVSAVYTPADGSLQASKSAATALAVTAAATTTSLSFASTAQYGSEQLDVFTVAVKASGITPAGTVTVSSGTTVLCTATLAAGSGSCTMAATALPTGTYQVNALFIPANEDTAASASAQKNLKVK